MISCALMSSKLKINLSPSWIMGAYTLGFKGCKTMDLIFDGGTTTFVFCPINPTEKVIKSKNGKFIFSKKTTLKITNLLKLLRNLLNKVI